MLINMKEMLEIADQYHFAVGAFNATESSLFRAVVEEAEAQNAPAIVQVAPGEFDFATREFYSYVRERLANSPVPFVLHLDHGKISSNASKQFKLVLLLLCWMVQNSPMTKTSGLQRKSPP